MNPDPSGIVRSYGATLIHPIGLLLTLAAGILMILLPRKYALIPFFFVALIIPIQQRIVVATLDFYMLRILVLFGWLRILLYGESQGFRWNIIDSLLIAWAAVTVVARTLLWQTFGAFVSTLGTAFDAIGIYFIVRFLVRDLKDMATMIRALVIISIPIALAMMIEYFVHRNMFAVFGGVPAVTILREGRLRCQAAFAHPILAGTYGATLIPLFVALWWQDRTSRQLTIIGLCLALIIVITSSSSGPIFSTMTAIFALFIWSLRKLTKLLRWGLLISLVVLHFLMEAPVWALIARVNVVGGSTGWHRYYLLDQFIRRFNEWWLVGIKSTDHWGWMLWDTTNHYVAVGKQGGIWGLILFILLIAYCFQSVGRTYWVLEDDLMKNKILVWTIGATLFAHVVTFFSISYFDQIMIVWYMLLAFIATLRGSIEKLERLKILRQVVLRLALKHSGASPEGAPILI